MEDAASSTGVRKPSFFVIDERVLRPQVGVRRREAGNRKSFVRAVAVLVAKQGGRRAGTSSRGDRGGGRGGTGSHPKWRYQQRVVVKARVVRSRSAHGRSRVREHVNYVERDGVDEQGGRGRAFGMDDYLSGDAVDVFVARSSDDRHHFRFIVSPEHGGALDLPTFTRELMVQTEVDLGTELDWVAVEHHNTDNPHVHLIIRGVDDRGADLVIGRDYISQGLRGRAQTIATRELGPRRESELDQERVGELRTDRATRIDRALSEEGLQAGGEIDVRPPRESELSFRERFRVEKITRLHHLESLGLAVEARSGRWHIDPELVEKLTRMARRAELGVELGRQAGKSFEFRDVALYDKSGPDAPSIQGEVVGRGRVDELAEHEHVFVASNAGDTAGKVYRVPLSAFSEQPEAPIRRGQIVTLSVSIRRTVSAADRNILKQAQREGGLYSAERHRQWLDATNANRAHPIEDVGQYIEYHVKRIQGHERRGFVQGVGAEIWRVPVDLAEQLEQSARTRRDRGEIVRIEPLSALTLSEQVNALGPTWLDQGLARAEHLKGPPGADAMTAERRLSTALLERVDELERRGMHVAQRALTSDEIERLYGTEIALVANRLTPHYGKHVSIDELQASGPDRGRRIEGKLERMENLASGPHAVIVNSKGFVVLPASSRTATQVGKQMAVVIRESRSQDRALPSAVQMRIQYAELERLRERDLGLSR